jgi:hypothetical protein
VVCGRDLPVFGGKEQVALPDWGIRRVRAKLDTGARSSALHVTDMRALSDSEEVPLPATAPDAMLRFAVVLGRGPDARQREVTAHAVDFRTVRNTGGGEEHRAVVRTRVICGPLDEEIELTVTDRTGMNFRMLLGRTALAGRCLVDPERGYLVSPHPPRREPDP